MIWFTVRDIYLDTVHTNMNFVVGAICEELAKIGFYYQQQITKGNLAITDMYYAQAYIRHMMTATT